MGLIRQEFKGGIITDLMPKPQILKSHMHLNRHTTFPHTNVSSTVLMSLWLHRQRKYKHDPHMRFLKQRKYSRLFFFSFFHQRPFLDLVGAQIMWKEGDTSGQNMNFTPRIPQYCAQCIIWTLRIFITKKFNVTLCSLCYSKSWQLIRHIKKHILYILWTWFNN